MGELVGGIAIIVSLAYVGLQIKQNTDALKLSTFRNTAEDMADLYLIPAQNGELAEIFFRGLQDVDALDGSKKFRLYGFFHKFYRTYENAHYQFSHHALDSETFGGLAKHLIFVTAYPGGQAYWQERKS